MKITYAKAIDAYAALVRTAKQRPQSLALCGALFRLRKRLEPVYEFYVETQQSIIEELGGAVDKAGVIRFAEQGAEEQYKDKMAELNRTDCEVDDAPVIRIPESAGLAYSPDDLWQLDPFVEVVEDKQTAEKE